MPFVKGKSGNPAGRVKGENPRVKALLDAIKVVEKRKRKKLLTHAVEQAYKDKTVLVALLKKLIPDLKAVEIAGMEGGSIKITVSKE